MSSYDTYRRFSSFDKSGDTHFWGGQNGPIFFFFRKRERFHFYTLDSERSVRWLRFEVFWIVWSLLSPSRTQHWLDGSIHFDVRYRLQRYSQPSFGHHEGGRYLPWNAYLSYCFVSWISHQFLPFRTSLFTIYGVQMGGSTPFSNFDLVSRSFCARLGPSKLK